MCSTKAGAAVNALIRAIASWSVAVDRVLGSLSNPMWLSLIWTK